MKKCYLLVYELRGLRVAAGVGAVAWPRDTLSTVITFLYVRVLQG